MNKQDSNGVRTAQDIERKYDFKKMLGLDKNVEITEKGLLKIENTLNEMLNALVINLSDVLESQSDISLWFYSGIPNGTSAPYTSWADPSQHYGDLYYDTNEGKVYKFYELTEYTSGTFVYGVHGMWDANASPDLLRAMAITNSEIDTSTDHERKVFLQTPTTPYSSGDWWIQSDGSLYICQLGRATGTFEEQDFINSSTYTPTIAESFDDMIEVLKGTVTMISDDCVRFTDLATGGSTTIAGENIKTGSIESNNYAHNVSGMQINLSQGTIDTKNFKTDTQGNVYLGTGGKVIGGDGLLTNLQYSSGAGYSRIGIYVNAATGTLNYFPAQLEIAATIPDNFTIVKSILTLVHIPIKWDGANWGYARNVGVYKQGLDNMWKLSWEGGMSFITEPTYTLIEDIFDGEDTWQPSVPSDSNYPIEITTTSDLDLQQGLNEIIIKTTTPPSEPAPDYNTGKLVCESQTGWGIALLDVYGYTSYEEGE